MAGEAFRRAGNRISIDVWSDIMCPFCYIGDTVLEQALSRFEHRANVDIRYHSYQLMPELPADQPVDLARTLSESKGMSIEQANAMNQQVAERGAQVGLNFRFDRAQTINTRQAHELSHFAEQHGRQHELMIRLFQAYFTDGQNVGDVDTLVDLAAEVGLDRDAARAALNSGEYSAAVDADIQEARAMGISGVPFFVFNRKYAVSGAQPEEVFLRALEAVWSEAA